MLSVPRAPEPMTPEQAIREAQEQKLRPVYLLVGEERHLEGKVVQALKAAATAGGIPGLNEDQVQAQETDVEAALAAARTLPMMAKRRFVLVRGLEHWEPRDNSDAKDKLSPLDRLLDYAQNPSPSTTLVLLGGESGQTPQASHECPQRRLAGEL